MVLTKTVESLQLNPIAGCRLRQVVWGWRGSAKPGKGRSFACGPALVNAPQLRNWEEAGQQEVTGSTSI